MQNKPEQILMYDDVIIIPAAVLMYHAEGRPHDRFPDERSARYAACTHRKCEKCGAPCSKHYVRCDGCSSLKEQEKHAALERRDWDGQSMVYSHRHGRWYTDPELVFDDMPDGETWEEQRVVMGRKLAAPQVDLSRWEESQDDYMTEDDGFCVDTTAPEINEALERLNAAIAANYTPTYMCTHIAVNEPREPAVA